MDERNPGLMRIVTLWEHAREGAAAKQDNYIALRARPGQSNGRAYIPDRR